MSTLNIPNNLLKLQKILDHNTYKITRVSVEPESKEYSACSFTVNDKKAHFRSGKITPTKVGIFVTFWKRNQKNITAPYDASDDFDFLIVSASSQDNFGIFIFPKKVLLEQKMISKNHIGGKRGFRLYPIWDKADNPQAIKSQKWQTNYFVTLQHNNHSAIIQKLLTI